MFSAVDGGAIGIQVQPAPLNYPSLDSLNVTRIMITDRCFDGSIRAGRFQVQPSVLQTA